MEGSPPQKPQAVSIGSILPQLLERWGQNLDVDLTRIWALWESAVGEAVAKNTRPVAFKGKLLLVHANSSPWLHHLQFLKKEIIVKVNQALGRELVGDIKFKIGKL